MNNAFSTRDVVKTAWHKVKGTKWPIWGPQLVMLAIYAGVALIFGLIGFAMGVIPKPGTASGPGFLAGLFVFEIVIIFLIAPLAAGIQMIALKQIRGEPISASSGFKYWHKWLPLGATILFFSIGSSVINQLFSNLIKVSSTVPLLSLLFSILFLITVLLYAAFLIFNVLFVADKNKGPLGALGHSAKMVAPHWFRVTLLMLYIVFVAIVMALPAGLGLLCPVMAVKILGVLVSLVLFVWVIPYWNLVLATIFHRLSGNQ